MKPRWAVGEWWERVNGWLSRLAVQGGYEDSEHLPDIFESEYEAMEEWDHSNDPEA